MMTMWWAGFFVGVAAHNTLWAALMIVLCRTDS